MSKIDRQAETPSVQAAVSTSLLWNKGERVEIVSGDLSHPGTRARGEIARVQPARVRVVDSAAAFQRIEYIVRIKVGRLYQISKTRSTD